jgi:uncharacterized protein YdaT
MTWMFEDFTIELKDLIPTVREKALEITKELVEKKRISAEEAIQKAILRAGEWFYDLEG